VFLVFNFLQKHNLVGKTLHIKLVNSSHEGESG